MDISVVIPLYNEEESLSELHNRIKQVMEDNGFSYEIIFVDDGSTDGSWDIIKSLKSSSEHVKAIKFRRNYGKSPAIVLFINPFGTYLTTNFYHVVLNSKTLK
jgi:glycosyltransferase involved in cell wall biosynthesis